jgi:hypothetical protein
VANKKVDKDIAGNTLHFGTQIVTPEMAKRVWDGLTAPTTHKVARVFKQAGLHIAQTTISKWHRQGWTGADTNTKVNLSRVDAYAHAKDTIEIAIPVLTGEPIVRLHEMIPKTEADEIEPDKPSVEPRSLKNARNIVLEVCREINAMTSEEMLVRKTRESCITSICVNRLIREQLPFLVTVKTEEFGNLLKALALIDQSAYGHDKMITERREREMKIVEGEMPTLDAEAEAELASLGLK